MMRDDRTAPPPPADQEARNLRARALLLRKQAYALLDRAEELDAAAHAKDGLS